MTMDAWSNTDDMSTSNEERRRTEAALVRALDMHPSVDTPETYAAVCQYVDLLADDGLLPEAVVIAFKAALGSAESLKRFDPDDREAIRSALVSACIQRYFTRRVADDMRVVRPPALRLVRDEIELQRRAGSRDASA
jgi:hypothetical protein